ncbi:MAG: hypothetical protein M0P74_00820 [Syntrophales bacterium]|jgi:hypothetical protein|nr:hypothetical protein [Syntrophales bacterium]
MSLELLDYRAYLANVAGHPLWKSYRARWQYHAAAIDWIRELGISDPKQVLEIGTFGAGLVNGSDRMDLPSGEWQEESPGIIRHDARILPWPFASRRYKLLIALRVWHHLFPVQGECFREAKRIAKQLIIECPEVEAVGQGISRDKFIEWNGAPPAAEKDFGPWGRLYLFGGAA